MRQPAAQDTHLSFTDGSAAAGPDAIYGFRVPRLAAQRLQQGFAEAQPQILAHPFNLVVLDLGRVVDARVAAAVWSSSAKIA